MNTLALGSVLTSIPLVLQQFTAGIVVPQGLAKMVIGRQR